MISLEKFVNGGYIETDYSSIFIRTIGEGSPLVVIHGGPGLEHSYLFEWLKPLSAYRTLIFYDQCGCGKDKSNISDVTASAMVDQFDSLFNTIPKDNGIGILSHSWGIYITLSFLQRNNVQGVNELVISNPTALTSARFDESGQRLMDRIPSDVQTIIGELESKNTIEAGAELMKTALPYYVSSPKNVPEIQFEFYNPDIFNKVAESMGDFDITNLCSLLPKNTLLIYGEDDFETQDGSKELQTTFAQKVIIPSTGHFSFAEDQKSFLDSVIPFLNKK